MRESVLKKYAKLIAVMGGNVRKGQEVIINAELDQPKFVEYVVEECYKAGASKVLIDWTYKQIDKLNYKLNNLPQLNLGDISTKTNALTARGGFASGIVRPQADRVNNQIMLNTQATNRLIQTVIGEIQKLGRI